MTTYSKLINDVQQYSTNHLQLYNTIIIESIKILNYCAKIELLMTISEKNKNTLKALIKKYKINNSCCYFKK